MSRGAVSVLAALAVFSAALWRGVSYDSSNRCPEVAVGVLRGVAVEVRVGTFGDRVLARGEGGAWGFVASVASGEVSVGERIEISEAKVSRIKDFTGDAGQIFPYANLMRSRGYCFEARRGEVLVLGNSGNPLDRARAWGAEIRGRIGEVLPPVAAALSAGALLGGDDGVGEDLEENARRAGLAHALALSGFNVAVFAGAVDWALRGFAPRGLRIIGGALAGWCLVTLAGLPPSGVRAAIAWSVGAVARLAFRRAEAPRALLYAALAYAAANPLALAFDLSLQLSLMACLGIAAWAREAADRMVGVPGVWGLREAAGATVAASIATLPISVWAFGQVSVVAPLSNAALAPVIPMMMWAGLAAAAVSALPVLSDAASPPLSVPAELFAYVARISGEPAWSAVPFAASSTFALLGSLALAAFALSSVVAARAREAGRDAEGLGRLLAASP